MYEVLIVIFLSSVTANLITIFLNDLPMVSFKVRVRTIIKRKE